MVVGSLLGTDIQNYEEHNANVAMLIGFAIGLGKETLVLQAQPKIINSRSGDCLPSIHYRNSGCAAR